MRRPEKPGVRKSIDGNLYRPFFIFFLSLSILLVNICQPSNRFYFINQSYLSFFPQLTNDDDSPFTFTNVHFQLRRNFFFPKKSFSVTGLSCHYHHENKLAKAKKIYLQNWVSESEANLASWLTWELLPRALEWVFLCIHYV